MTREAQCSRSQFHYQAQRRFLPVAGRFSQTATSPIYCALADIVLYIPTPQSADNWCERIPEPSSKCTEAKARQPGAAALGAAELTAKSDATCVRED